MIAPFWRQIRIGPYLRRQREKGNYQRFFSNTGYISGVQRLWLLPTLKKIPENQYEQESHGSTRAVVVFKGMSGLFEAMRSRHAEVLAELRRITKPPYLNTGLSKTRFIGIHVRRGDFSVPPNLDVLRQGKYNYQIPLEWYVLALKSIRAGLGFEAPAVVFSDGSEAELLELLKLPNVRFHKGAAITDLLSLSEACAMVASGSTFSMWASFLGQVPCVWFPGQRRQCVIGSEDEATTVEPELEFGAALPDGFMAVLRQRWGHDVIKLQK